MDGRGAWRDNVFVERFWRSLKYEEVYLRAYETASEAKHFIGRYVAFYNADRAHSALDGQTQTTYTSTSRSRRRHNLGGHHITEAVWLFKKPALPLKF